jgi:hypothetical protein
MLICSTAHIRPYIRLENAKTLEFLSFQYWVIVLSFQKLPRNLGKFWKSLLGVGFTRLEKNSQV